jgi:hypothetical protein
MDQFSEHYQDLIEDSYDCVDRIVLNSYFRSAQYPGGFRVWWRALYGSDEGLDTNHLMRMAVRFSRRVRAYAKAAGIPVVDCAPKEKKFEIAAKHLCEHDGKPGVFLILVAKAKAPVWEVLQSKSGTIIDIRRKKPMPFVNHYSFHIWDAEWGHITIKMCGHPPFGAQIILNGHDYVARGARKSGIEFQKEGNCFIHTANGAALARIADTLSEPETEGRLRQLCDRWIYSACLLFGLDLAEQERSGFQYLYSTYQLEYSRNLGFRSGKQMWEVLQRLVDRTRSRLDLKVVKTIFGFKRRPSVKRLKQNQWGVEVETPIYDLTVFPVHYGKLSLKIYSKGDNVLRIEVMVHNASETPYGRKLENFPRTVGWMKDVIGRFLKRLALCGDLLHRRSDVGGTAGAKHRRQNPSRRRRRQSFPRALDHASDCGVIDFTRRIQRRRPCQQGPKPGGLARCGIHVSASGLRSQETARQTVGAAEREFTPL